jgi:hypothetical protein
LVNDADGKDQISVKEFWNNFNIKNAIDNIAYAWAEVTQSCMKGVWKIWPELSCSSDFNPENELSNSRQDIIDMARAVGFEDVEQANVDELLQSHLSELTNEDLLEMENDRENDKEGELNVEPIKHHSTAQLMEFFQHIDNAIKIIEENDPNTDRSAKVSREIQNCLACYKELYRECTVHFCVILQLIK